VIKIEELKAGQGYRFFGNKIIEDSKRSEWVMAKFSPVNPNTALFKSLDGFNQSIWIDLSERYLVKEQSKITLEDYQNDVKRTIRPTSIEKLLNMGALGLAGESGEVVDLVKKYLYHGHALDKEKIKEELGDVLWYLTMLGGLVDVSLTEIMSANVQKRQKRYPNGFSKERSVNRDIIDALVYAHAAVGKRVKSL